MLVQFNIIRILKKPRREQIRGFHNFDFFLNYQKHILTQGRRIINLFKMIYNQFSFA